MKFSGNAGTDTYMGSSLQPLEAFMDANMGTHHDSAWNRFHFPNDKQGIFYPGDCNPPDGSGGLIDCNWIDAKQAALNYINANLDKKIVLAGYHYGGGAATFLGQDLANSGRQVEGIFLTDPVGPGPLLPTPGNTRIGIMQECAIGNINPIDLTCIRFKTPKICSDHGDFKLVGLTTCGKDPNPCPPSPDLVHTAFGECRSVIRFASSCPAGYGFNDINTECIAPGQNCNIFGVCDVSLCPASPNSVRTAINLCITPLIVAPNCHPGYRANFPTGPTLCIADQTCPSGTSFNFFESACVVQPAVIDPLTNLKLDGPYSIDCLTENKHCTNTCPHGMFESVSPNECNAGFNINTNGKANRVMNSNIKGIVVSYQIQAPFPSDNFVFFPSPIFQSIDGPWHFSEWEDFVHGRFSPFKLHCDPGDALICNIIIGNLAPKQTEFINHLNSLNAKPTISITSGTHFEILEGESAPTEITTVSQDHRGLGELIGDMKLFPRLNSLDGGDDPTDVIDDGIIDGNTIQKQATFEIIVDAADGPATVTKTVWVEDNGWPCDNCSTNPNDGGATGKWDKADVTFTILNVPPTPILVGELTQTRAKAFTFNAIDPSAADQAAGFKYTVTWWDGTKSTIDKLTVGDVPIKAPEIRVPGDYTFAVTAEDKDGGVSKPVSFTITIPDSDGDGIADGVDLLPEEFSDDFSDVNFCEVGIPNVDSGLCEIEPSCSFGDFNKVTDKCETEPLCDPDFIYNPETNSCEMDDQMAEPSCIDNENQDFNPDTDVCESSPICPDSTNFNSEINMCISKIIPGDTEGTITDRGDQDVSVINEFVPDGVYIGTFSFDDGTPMKILSADNGSVEKAVQIQVLEPDPGAPAEISVCGDSALLRLHFEESLIVTCGSVTIEALEGTIEAEFQGGCKTRSATLTPGQILTFDPRSFKFTNDGPTDITINEKLRSLLERFFVLLKAGASVNVGSGCGGGETHEPPTIGKNLAGTKQMVNNGFCIDADCFTVTKLFHEEFKLYEMMSGTHTLSTLVYCAQGIGHCNYSAIGVMPYDKDMNDTVWKIEMKGNHLREWTPVIFDPEGFLGEVTVTTQIVSDKFLSVSYTIEFKNKQTPPMKVGVQLRDDKNGVRNFYFNEGVKFNDSDAYPYVETSFEQSIEVKPLCINPQSHDRDSCGFELVRDWTQKKAQDLLNDMQNGNYIYDKYVRDRYYD